jgi:hypothetical protein
MGLPLTVDYDELCKARGRNQDFGPSTVISGSLDSAPVKGVLWSMGCGNGAAALQAALAFRI